jgi:hypothetical protein
MSDSIPPIPPPVYERPKWHLRQKVVEYGPDSQRQVMQVLEAACADGWEPIGIVLVPGASANSFSVAVFLKTICPGTLSCPHCEADAFRLVKKK